MKPRILLVEDEKNLMEGIKLNLEMENYEVIAAMDGSAALKTFKEQYFNLIVLDVMLPKMNGYDVCEQIRLRDEHTPILFLTAKDSGDDKVFGLKKGADDYLTKPFNLQELLLRVKILVKHSLKRTEQKEYYNIYRFGHNEIDFGSYRAKTINGEFNLSAKEVKLLRFFIDRKNEVVSRQDILQIVWGYDVFPNTRTIDNFIMTIRKYFEEDPRQPRHFHSVRGIGYKFME